MNAVPPSATVPPAGIPPVAGPPAATQPVQSTTPQVPGATQPVRTTAGTSQLMSAPSHQVSGSQPVSAAAQPAETRGRRRASRSDDEDPLTSAAFSLRTSGPVDGRSSRRSRDMTREQYDAAVTQETQTFTAAETEAASGGYPGGMPPFRQSESSYSGTSYSDPSSVTQAMNTPLYGENYGYGSRGSRPSRTTLGGTMAPGVTPGTAVTTKPPGRHGSRTRRTAIRAPAATRPTFTRAPAVTRPAAIRAVLIQVAPTRAMPMGTGVAAIAPRMTRGTTTVG